MNKKRSIFISVEGADGCGKSTIISMVYEDLKQKYQNIILSREPGGVVISEEIRKIILNPKNTSIDPITEALLFSASRRQHIIEKIIPVLKKENGIVLCDRYIDSSIVYQGYVQSEDNEYIQKIIDINKPAIDISNFNIDNRKYLYPDLTIVFDINLETALNRSSKRGEKDRLDAKGSLFHKKVIDGYKKLTLEYPNRIKVVDANNDIDTVYKDVYNIIHSFLYFNLMI